jgi:cobalt-zinc-cadmium efflux system membrane fusion protein
MTIGLPVLAALLVAVGCDQKSASTPLAEKDTSKVAKKVDDHSGWWCDEHALPEEVCDLCSRKYREAEKKKGNWCEHDRVKTSCFKCNPDLQAKWAKEYEARFGTKPPEPEPDKPAAKDNGKK